MSALPEPRASTYVAAPVDPVAGRRQITSSVLVAVGSLADVDPALGRLAIDVPAGDPARRLVLGLQRLRNRIAMFVPADPAEARRVLDRCTDEEFTERVERFRSLLDEFDLRLTTALVSLGRPGGAPPASGARPARSRRRAA